MDYLIFLALLTTILALVLAFCWLAFAATTGDAAGEDIEAREDREVRDLYGPEREGEA